MVPDSRANKKVSEYSLSVITGGSSGIGNVIIERILKIGPGPRICNLSRTKPSSLIIGSDFEHLECDLADKTNRSQVFSKLLTSISQSDDTGPILLINNAGFGLYDSVLTKPIPEHLELLEVNIAALVELTLTLLPIIKERGGTVMNIASTSAFQPTPFLATYGASKSFVLDWTLALNEELKGTAANAIAVCPGPTRTNFFKRAGFTSQSVPKGYSHQPEEVVELAFKALAKNKPLVVTGLLNQLIACLSSKLPKVFGTRIAGKTISRYRST